MSADAEFWCVFFPRAAAGNRFRESFGDIGAPVAFLVLQRDHHAARRNVP
jgi:hypothetical protein